MTFMRVLLCFFFLWLTGPFAQGQQIIWEKYWPNIKGEFTSVVQGDSSYYFGVGNLTYIRNFNGPHKDTIKGCLLVKIRENGDTVWIKKVGDEAYTDPVIFFNENQTLTLAYMYIWWPVFEYRITLITQATGLVISQSTVNNFNLFSIPKGVTRDLESNIWVFGERPKLGVSGQYEMACIKISPEGEMQFFEGYNPGNHPYSAAQYIEPMPGGKMRMSGNKGKTIVAYELNADGSVADYKEYMDNPYNYVQQNGAYVQQSDSGHFLASVRLFDGSSPPNNLKSQVKKVNAQGNVIWNGIRPYGITQPIPLLDGGYIITAGNVTDYFVQRFKSDSTLEWQENFMPDPNSIKGFNGMLFNNNEGLCYGQLSRFATNPGWFPYIAKIANVGYPVDPTNPVPPVVGVKELKKKAEISYAVPNPTTGIFHVLGMGSGHFRMVDAQGRTVMEAEHKGGDAIDVSGLPCGVYTYTLVTKGSRTEGRVVRE